MLSREGTWRLKPYCCLVTLLALQEYAKKWIIYGMIDRAKVAVVAGTRPEVIKMVPVYKALKKLASTEVLFISTAQHRQMLDQAMSIFGIKSDFDMNVMRQGQSLNSLMSRLMASWDDYFSSNRLDAVLVQGDTTTVLATAIAAFHAGVKIGHVEAGLRTFNMHSPFPEEMNRRLTDPLADWCFAPTDSNLKNLLKEGITPEKCFVTGNTVIDSLFLMREKLRIDGVDGAAVAARYSIPEEFSRRHLSGTAPWILVTGHRRENFGKGFENLCAALKTLSEKYPGVGILYPVHLNPNVTGPVYRILSGCSNIALIPPVGYEDFIWLMDKCSFVISDSGGVQEEAPSLGKPVIVTRDTTERPEGVEAGTCVLAGTDPDKIVGEASLLLSDHEEYARRSSLKNPYGDGMASERIAKILEKSICK